jgi:hypothetical protein
VAGAAQRDEQVDKIDPRVEDRDESIRHPVRRALHRITFLKTALHTEFLTRPRHAERPIESSTFVEPKMMRNAFIGLV